MQFQQLIMANEWKQNVMEAVERRDQATLEILLQSPDKQSLDFMIESHSQYSRTESHSPLTKAVRNCQSGIVEQLLCAGASVNFHVSGKTPIGIAASEANTTLCKILLRYGPKVNSRNKFGLTPLCSAAMYDMGEVAALLLEKGAQLFNPSTPLNNLQAFSTSPLVICIKYRHLHILEQFMEHAHKINVSLPLATLFHRSVCYGTEYCTILLLRQGYYPALGSAKEFVMKMSCFYMAARKYHRTIMRLMVAVNPYFLQEEWLINQEFPMRLTLDGEFISWLFESRKQPPALTKLCRSTILAQLDCSYLRRGLIDDLPLPNSLKAFLKEY